MRILETEWLDTLPASDPRAEHSRRDLRRINTLMGNARHIAAALRPHWREGMRIADLGSRRRLADARSGTPSSRGSRRHFRRQIRWASTFWSSCASRQELDAIVCNLFLHHLDGDVLSDVLCARRRARAALRRVRAAPRAHRAAGKPHGVGAGLQRGHAP